MVGGKLGGLEGMGKNNTGGMRFHIRDPLPCSQSSQPEQMSETERGWRMGWMLVERWMNELTDSDE